MQQPWTTKQNKLLMQFSHLGVDACCRMLSEECGVKRSRSSVQRHGSRIGVSFAREFTCPGCGFVSTDESMFVRTTGLCKACHAEQVYQDYMHARFVKKGRSDEVEKRAAKAKRDYDAARARAKRAGMKKVSAKASKRRSEGQMTLF